MKGIDVSSHQGLIDWAKVAGAGIQFAIVRAGYGRFVSQVDQQFQKNMEGALAAGLHAGAYWFSYALSPDEAREEAALCASTLEPYRGRLEFPVYFDYEYDSERYARAHGVTPTQALREQLAAAFCMELERRGWRAGVYTNKDYLNSRWSLSALSAWEIWLADYTGGPDIACGMQQTGSTGRVDGISGNVDTDTAFVDYPALIRAGGWNGFAAQASAPGWASDTTNGTDNPVLIAPDKHYTVKITGEDIGLVCGESGGLPAAFRLVRCRREGDATLWHVVPVGRPGQEAGIYPAKGGERIFVARIEEGAG
ncbi:MAG TPA: hypothetical protein IAB66_03325 [Candidatus Caccousia avistercoris]|nr:hypothetical protein [Candidatus Caccousia avistercoris]